MPSDQVVPPPGDRRRGVVALEGQGVAIAPGVVAGEPGGDQAEAQGREPDQAPAELPAAGLGQPPAEVGRAVGPGVALLEGGHAAGQAGEVVGGEVPEPFELLAVDLLELLGQPAQRPFEAERVQLGGAAGRRRPPGRRR